MQTSINYVAQQKSFNKILIKNVKTFMFPYLVIKSMWNVGSIKKASFS